MNRNVQKIWDMLTDSEKHGIRFGLFPMRILAIQKKLKVSASELMQHAASVAA